MHRRSFVDYDGSEYTFTIDENNSIDNNFTQEFHLRGSNFNDRVNWLARSLHARRENQVARRPLGRLGPAAPARQHQRGPTRAIA